MGENSSPSDLNIHTYPWYDSPHSLELDMYLFCHFCYIILRILDLYKLMNRAVAALFRYYILTH